MPAIGDSERCRRLSTTQKFSRTNDLLDIADNVARQLPLEGFKNRIDSRLQNSLEFNGLFLV